MERRLLQAAFAVAGLVPVGGGLWGALGFMATRGAASASNARYLSGLLLGVGLAFWACIPAIERRGTVVRTLAAIVVVGGLARLAGAVVATGFPSAVSLPLIMELGVTPLLALWRERVARRLG
ncbi:MAG TPA: DUF4345 family protein [Phenylobacterium sp.]